MTDRAAKLLAQALALPDHERAEVAAQLLHSLDPSVEEGTQAAWDAEIRDRLEELRTGPVKTVPWPEARRLILEDAGEADEA